VFQDKFGCDFLVYNDLDSTQIREEFLRLAHKDYSEYDYVTVAILSHGDRINQDDLIIGSGARFTNL
jgi:hypothetical protein